MEYKTVPLEVTAVDEATGAFRGYASVFNNLDLQNEIVRKGAFTKTLKERGDRVVICWQHDLNQPIGKMTSAVEDGHGLRIEARLAPVPKAQEARELMKAGIVTELSIGYDVMKDAWTTVDNKSVRELHEVRLYEISLVTIGANPSAIVTDVKGAIPYKRTPLADPGEEWDAGAEVAEADVDDLRQMCAMIVGDPEDKSSYKLPHHTQQGYECVWRGVSAAAAALVGARGGVEGEGQDGAKAHIAKHYADFDKGEPPWAKGFTLFDLKHYEQGDWPNIIAHQLELHGLDDMIAPVDTGEAVEPSTQTLELKRRKLSVKLRLAKVAQNES